MAAVACVGAPGFETPTSAVYRATHGDHDADQLRLA
ncbi:MAG: hypothetical protein ACI8TP_001485 [Acidimicrobiales bacterium]|jgi:hypothetical protein